jgi:uncharacterized protein (DUF1330 family)
VSIAQPTYGRINGEQNDRLRKVRPDQDGPFFMLNLMRYRPLAVYGDGRETTLTGMQADDVYAPVEILHDLGAEIVLFGDVVDQPRGSESWHRVAIVRYPTVQSFLQMQERPDFSERHQHKDAGMESTVIATCTPLSGGLEVSTGPLLVDLVTTDPEAVVARGGEAVLRVDHTLIGDATDPAVLVLRPLPAGTAAAEDLLPAAGPATTVMMTPLLNTLPSWLPADATV